MIKNLEHRIASLEARQPPLKSDWQKFLERLTDEELTAIEFNFLEESEIKYAPVQEPE